jgi:hypothetical protein
VQGSAPGRLRGRDGPVRREQRISAKPSPTGCNPDAERDNNARRNDRIPQSAAADRGSRPRCRHCGWPRYRDSRAGCGALLDGSRCHLSVIPINLSLILRSKVNRVQFLKCHPSGQARYARADVRREREQCHSAQLKQRSRCASLMRLAYERKWPCPFAALPRMTGCGLGRPYRSRAASGPLRGDRGRRGTRAGVHSATAAACPVNQHFRLSAA